MRWRGATWLAALLLLLTCAHAPAAPQTQPVAQTPPAAAAPPAPLPSAAPQTAATPPVADLLQRVVPLAELGFEKGAEFTSFGGQRDFYFPVPRQGLKSATLRIHLRSGSAIAGRRHIQVLVGERIIHTQALGSENAGETIDLNIDPLLAKDGLLAISFRYSGAFTQDRCVDQRVAGDFVDILPTTALDMQLAPEAYRDIRSVLGLMPHEVSIVLPDRSLKSNEIAAALRIAAVLKRQHFDVSFQTADAMTPQTGRTWSRGLVMIGVPQDFPSLPASLSAATNGITLAEVQHLPVLIISGKNPAPAIALLASRWKPLADAATLSVNELAGNGGPRQSMSLADLGIGLMSADLVDQVRFDTGFTTDALPHASRITGLRIDLALGVAPNAANATIAVFLNGRLLGSRASPGAVPATLTVPVPEGLVGRDNVLSVRVQRQPNTGDCVNPPLGYTVQLLPSSAVELSTTTAPPTDFFALGAYFHNGVDVYLPAEPAALLSAMTLFTGTAADFLPDAAPVNVRTGVPDATDDGPFIVVSRTAPPSASPPVRFDRGRVIVSRDDGKVLLDLATTSVPTIAQIVSAGPATGLWLRPGDGTPAPAPALRPVRLDRGNIAIIDETGVALAFSGERTSQLVNITYVDIRNWKDLAREYRAWIAGAIWFAMTMLFVVLLSRLYRRRRKE